MSEQEKKENQKTIVAFAAGLLIGGLLVWVFGGSAKTDKPTEDQNASTTEQTVTVTPSKDETTKTDDKTTEAPKAEVKPVLNTGEGKVEVVDQKAGSSVDLKSATFPSDEGWIGVRDYVNGQPAGLLGVARFSKVQGLVPEAVTLQRATVAGKTYAVVFYSESGDRVFSLANDVQVPGVFATFTAN